MCLTYLFQKCNTIDVIDTVADKADDNNIHGDDDDYNATEVGRKGKGSSDKGNKAVIELCEWNFQISSNNWSTTTCCLGQRYVHVPSPDLSRLSPQHDLGDRLGTKYRSSFIRRSFSRETPGSSNVKLAESECEKQEEYSANVTPCQELFSDKYVKIQFFSIIFRLFCDCL